MCARQKPAMASANRAIITPLFGVFPHKFRRVHKASNFRWELRPSSLFQTLLAHFFKILVSFCQSAQRLIYRLVILNLAFIGIPPGFLTQLIADYHQCYKGYEVVYHYIQQCHRARLSGFRFNAFSPHLSNCHKTFVKEIWIPILRMATGHHILSREALLSLQNLG